jgi:D-sedoheptulose 7-phosphate isomerase
MTCLGNDYGYEQVFSYPLEKLLKPQDLLVAISSSGKSPNIIKAVETALSVQVSVVTLSGFSSQNPLRSLGDLNFWVNRTDYGLVETSHFFLLHAIVDLWLKHSAPDQNHGKIAAIACP